MGVKVTGLKELTDKLDKMTTHLDKAGKRALEQAGQIVLDEERAVVKSTHNKYSENVGINELKKYPVKIGSKHKSKYINIGIRAKLTSTQKKKDSANKQAGMHRPTHWDRIKGLWYNNYGFFHNRTGKYVTGTDWIGTAYERSIDRAYQKIQSELEKEIKL